MSDISWRDISGLITNYILMINVYCKELGKKTASNFRRHLGEGGSTMVRWANLCSNKTLSQERSMLPEATTNDLKNRLFH